MATADLVVTFRVNVNFPGRAVLSVLQEVGHEVMDSVHKHGAESMLAGQPDGVALGILVEEVGEVARALTYDEGDRDELREELIQVAAMATAWVVALDSE
jgi:hypothetical protein